jgi:CBS domain containing-hemolysin-like protein
VLFIVLNLVEALARGIGRSHPREVHLFEFPFLLAVQTILKPIQQPLFFIRTRLVSLLSRKIPASPGPTIEQEIQTLAEKTGVLGELDPTERELIREVFDFSDTVAREIMTPRVDIIALQADATVDDAIALFVESGFSRLPIFERDLDRILGLILSKDLLPLAGKPEELQNPISNYLHEVYIVPETKRIGEVLKDLQTNRLHLAVVVDEYGGTAGILTLEDILEELVGEIHDEHDQDEEELVKHTKTGAMLLDARLPIEEVPAVLHWPIPESDQYETVGGYIISELGRIPEQGEEVTIRNLTLLVDEADSRHLMRLRVLPPADEEAPLPPSMDTAESHHPPLHEPYKSNSDSIMSS